MWWNMTLRSYLKKEVHCFDRPPSASVDYGLEYCHINAGEIITLLDVVWLYRVALREAYNHSADALSQHPKKTCHENDNSFHEAIPTIDISCEVHSKASPVPYKCRPRFSVHAFWAEKGDCTNQKSVLPEHQNNGWRHAVMGPQEARASVMKVKRRRKFSSRCTTKTPTDRTVRRPVPKHDWTSRRVKNTWLSSNKIFLDAYQHWGAAYSIEIPVM